MTANGRDIHILECSLRDSSYAVDFQFSVEHTRQVAHGLEEAGFQFVEVGHGLGLGVTQPNMGIAAATDEQYLEAVASTLKRTKFGTFLIPGIGELRHLDMLRSYGASFVRIGCNATEVDSVKDFIPYAKKLGLMTFVNLMKTYAVSQKNFLQIAGDLYERGIDVLYLVDSAGCMSPNDIHSYVQTVKEGLDQLKVGLHAHNNLHLAVANALAAVEAGCDFIDTTLRGVGRSAGNAQTEVVLGLLQREGYLPHIDLYRTLDLSEKVFLPILESLATRVPNLNKFELYRGVSDIEIVVGLAKCHSSFLKNMTLMADRYQVDLRRLILAVSKVDFVNPSKELIENIARDLSLAPHA